MVDYKLNKKLEHIAFIMDGNGRWAKKRLLPRTRGHKEACSRIIEVLRACKDLNIKVASLYAFSTENWNRPQDEIDKLFEYLDDFFNDYIQEFIETGVRVSVMGDISRLPKHTQETIEKAKKLTENNTKIVFNICLNYGGRQEIVRATKLIVEDIKAIVAANKENPDGPARGRRLKEKFSNVKSSKLKAVKKDAKKEAK